MAMPNEYRGENPPSVPVESVGISYGSAGKPSGDGPAAAWGGITQSESETSEKESNVKDSLDDAKLFPLL